MADILVDANVLLDVLTNDPTWAQWSSGALEQHAQEGELFVNAIIYAEVSIAFTCIEELDAALADASIKLKETPREAAFLAGKCFLKYRRSGGTKRSPLPDFFIGAHAAVEKMRLLTRDSARYRTYFPTVDIVAPPA